MAFAVLHSNKGSSSGGGLGNHIDREKGKEHTYPDADLSRTNLNFSWQANKHCQEPMYKAIKNRIEEGYTGKRKIRSDAVTHLTHILSGSHEQMKKIENDPELRKKWLNKNAAWAVKEFGKENIVRFVLHRDEKTMHLHLVTVPLTKDGRLSAKEVMGNKKKMVERQTSYAVAMNEFGLERGRPSDSQHITVEQWKERNQIKKETERLYLQRDDAREKFLDMGEKTIPKLEKELSELKKSYERQVIEERKSKNQDRELDR